MKLRIWGILFFIIGIVGCLLATHYKVIKIENVLDSKRNNQGFTKPQVDSLRKFAKQNNYNTHLGIFINFKIHSGDYRFFLVDLDSNKALLRGLCCHGSGKSSFNESVSFSNDIGSNCSSLGIYKIGYKYNGRFGTAYKLSGLCSTNCNAFDRFVVLHGHDCVPRYPVPHSICESLGCPTLAPEILSKLEPYLDKSETPILLWIY
jgi:hypothetical protein